MTLLQFRQAAGLEACLSCIPLMYLFNVSRSMLVPVVICICALGFVEPSLYASAWMKIVVCCASLCRQR